MTFKEINKAVGKKNILWYLSLVVLSMALLDRLLTVLIIRNGGMEGNPFMANLSFTIGTFVEVVVFCLLSTIAVISNNRLALYLEILLLGITNANNLIVIFILNLRG